MCPKNLPKILTKCLRKNQCFYLALLAKEGCSIVEVHLAFSACSQALLSKLETNHSIEHMGV